MTQETPQVELRTSPHLQRPIRTDAIMRNVVYALIPVAAFSIYAFGLSALLLIATSTASCLLTEFLVRRLSKVENTAGDWSAVVTGILFALTLPPGLPLWIAAVGGVICIVLGKLLFGGLGYNPFNPALVGRAFLQAAFTVPMTRWAAAFAPGRFVQAIPSTLALPFMQAPEFDAWSGATPLAMWKFQQTATDMKDVMSAFMGTIEGSAGETSALVILICGAYLAVRKMMDWRIPAGMLGSVFVFSGVFYLINNANPNPLFMLCSGGLMLGAVFMATDMVTSPTTPVGVWIFGVLTGFLTVLIRLYGALPEGVMYAILLGNALTPIINALTQPKIYGAKKAKAKVEQTQ